MRTLPAELYDEDFTQRPLNPVYQKALKGIERAEENKDCGKWAVGLVLLLSGGCFVKYNNDSPINIIELQLIIGISLLAYCLAICAIVREPNVKSSMSPHNDV